MKSVWARSAVAELAALQEFIARDKPSSAKQVARKILLGIETIKQFPNIGKAGRKPNTREYAILGTPFIVVYYVKTECIYIVSILHGALG